MRILLLTIFALLFITGCSVSNTPNTLINNFKLQNQQAVDNLLQNTKIPQNCKIIVTTFANNNNLSQSSKLGRIITEQVITDIVNHNIKVLELKIRKGDIIYIKQQNGEFILTRNAKNLIKTQKACGVLVGTYSVININKSYQEIYVNMKLIDPKTNVIISSIDYIEPIYLSKNER